MSKITGKKPFKPYKPYNRFSKADGIAPKIEPNEGAVRDLFLAVSDGNYLDIDKVLNDKNITLSVLSDEGNSVLHEVLGNTNLTKNEKRNLTIRLIDRNAPVGVLNNQNESALSIACKHGVDVVKLLIEKGDNKDKGDSQLMTPLHHAVSSMTVECVDEKDRKETLIKEINPDRARGTGNDMDLDMINDPKNKSEGMKIMINEIIKNSPLCLEYFRHIANIMLNPSTHYTEDFDKRVKETIDDLRKSINKDSLDGKYERETFSQGFRNLTNNAENSIKSKLKSTTGDVDSYIEKGESDSPGDIGARILKNIKDSGSRTVEGFKRDVSDLSNSLTGFWAEFSAIQTGFANLILACYATEASSMGTNVSDFSVNNELHYTDIVRPVIWRTLIRRLSVDATPDMYKINEAGKPVMDAMGNIAHRPQEYELDSEDMDDINGRNFRDIPDPDPARPNLDESINQFSIEAPYVDGNGNISKPDTNYDNIRGRGRETIPSTTYRLILNSDSGYSIFNIINRLQYTFEDFTETLSEEIETVLIDHAENAGSVQVMGDILDFQSRISNICGQLEVLKITVERDLNEVLERLGETCGNLGDRMSRAGLEFSNGMRTFASGTVMNKFKEFFEEKTGRIEGMVNVIRQVYARATGLTQSLNKVIQEYVNPLQGYRYIEIYMNGFRNVNNPIANPMTDIAYTPYPRFPGIPQSMVELDSTLGDTNSRATRVIDEIKRFMIKYGSLKNNGDKLPELSIISAGGDFDPRIGFLPSGGTNLNTIDFDFDLNTIGHYDIGNQRVNLTALPATFEGTFMVVDSIPPSRRDDPRYMVPIVRTVLDKHLSFVKYILYRLILQFNEGRRLAGRSYISEIYISPLFNELFKETIEKLSNIGAKNLVYYISGNYKYNHNIDAREFFFYNSGMESFKEIRDNMDDFLIENIERNDLGTINQINKNFEKVKEKKQIKVMDIFSDKEICYEDNSEVVEDLINAGVNVNAKDASGDVPIMKVIEARNIDLLNILLNSTVSTYSEKSRNKAGLTPYMYSAKQLQRYAKMFNINNIIKDIREQLEKQIVDESNYGSLLNRAKLVLPMVIYLINHQLTEQEIHSGVDDWTFDDHKKLRRALGVREDGLPIVHDSGVDSKDKNVDEINRLGIKIRERMNKKVEQIKSMQNSIANINDELRSIVRGRSSKNDYRANRLQTLLDNSNFRLREMQNEFDSLNRKLVTLLDAKRRVRTANPDSHRDLPDLDFTDPALRESVSKGSIIGYYKKIFDETRGPRSTNADLSTYVRLWDDLLVKFKNGKYDSLQLPLLAIEKIANTDFSIDNVKLSNCDVVCKFMSKVLKKSIDDYFSLPEQLNRFNYMLDAFIDIYSHVISITLSVNYYTVLVKMVYDHVVSKSTETDKSFIKQKLSEIFDSGGENELLKYIMGNMSKLMVRGVLFKDDGDVMGDRKVKDLNTNTDPTYLLTNALDIIIDNRRFGISEESEFVSSIKKNIIPYFKKYYERYIMAMKGVTEIYLKTLKFITVDADIFRDIYDHSLKEKNAMN